MSVFLKGRRWPDSRVPYTIVSDTGDAARWFAEVNAAIGYPLLVPHTHGDTMNLILTVGANSKSEQIGWKGGGDQTIGGTDKRTVIHELLHALGFRHEQLHRNLPWDDSDPPRTTVDRMFSYATKCKTPGNKLLYEKIKTYASRGSGIFYADNNLTSRVEALLDAGNEHWRDCDLDSVMMYPDFRSAIIDAQMGHVPGVTQSGKFSETSVLSNQDVDALKYMYPRL